MLSIFKSSSIVFQRVAGGDYNRAGDWVPDASPTTVATVGNLQPYDKGKTSVVLPEGTTENDSLIYRTKTKLNPASQITKTEADYGIVDGDKYEVFHVQDWTRAGLSTSHYACVLIRSDLTTSSPA